MESRLDAIEIQINELKKEVHLLNERVGFLDRNTAARDDYSAIEIQSLRSRIEILEHRLNIDEGFRQRVTPA